MSLGETRQSAPQSLDLKCFFIVPLPQFNFDLSFFFFAPLFLSFLVEDGEQLL